VSTKDAHAGSPLLQRNSQGPNDFGITRRAAGIIATSAEPAAIADLLITLMPGMPVMKHLYELASPDSIASGTELFATARTD
jgi:hypothetical protein